MGRLAEKVLLQEFVREVLREDDGGVYGDLAMADAMQNPWGVSFGSGKDLYNIFVKPFADVVQTAAGKTKELSQRGQTLLRVTFETVATTLIPFLTDSYNEIFEHEKEKLDKIRSEYAEVYRSNWDAFKDEDFQLLAFMYNPGRFITSKVLKKSPAVAVELLSIVSGGTLDAYLDPIKKALDSGEEPLTGLDRANGKRKNVEDVFGSGGGGGYDVGWGGGGGHHMEGVIREAEGSQQPATPEQKLANPKLIQAVNNSQMARKMRQQAQQLVRAPLTQVYKQAQAVLGANSIQDLQQKLGKRLKGAEKLEQIEPQARQAAEQQLMAGVKKSMKDFYIKSLTQQAKKFEGTPVLDDYKQAISKIKAL